MIHIDHFICLIVVLNNKKLKKQIRVEMAQQTTSQVS